MRSVDIDKIIDFCNELEKHFDYKSIRKVPSFLVGIWTIKEFVESLPTFETVKHGKWMEYKDICIYCSECGCENRTDKTYKYCPHCGAEMDGAGDE